MSAVAGPTHTGPVLLDDVSDLFALGFEQIAQPGVDGKDEYINIMMGPGAWPEFDESVFEQRKEMLSGIKSRVTQARAVWDAVHATIFNGLFVWVGDSASAAAAKADQHSKAMQEIEKQLADAMEWCANAWLTTRLAKKAIADYVELKRNEIKNLIDKAEEGTEKDDAKDAGKRIAEQVYLENKKFLDNLADSLSGKTEAAGSPQSESHAAAPLDNGNGASGAGQVGSGESGSGNSPSVSFAGNTTQKQPQSGDSGAADGDAEAVAAATGGQGDNKGESAQAPGPAVGGDAEAVAAATGGQGDNKGESAPGPAVGGDAEAVAAATGGQGDNKGESAQAPPAVFMPPSGQPTLGGRPPTPSASGTPSAPVASATPSLTGAPSAASSALSGGSSSGAGAGMDPSKAAGAADGLAGRAPADPMKAFSQPLADPAGTPVHAASAGGAAPPPLAPSPVVPAGDAMAPASSTSAPTALSSAQTPAAPLQAPSSGGSMGMGGGGMPMAPPPLGPPPTPPPAAPVATPAAAAPAPAPAQPTMAGGAQIAPIPVSAARAERDAAQNAAKRSGSDPLVLARRIAAALNAPDMLNVEDFDFYWITALTAQGQIVVANNYGLAYLPAQVRLPEQVKLVSADESIPASERASFAIHPMVAVQRWAQHHDTTLRAVIGCEEHFANSDAGAHKVVLTPEDIPAKGQMAGRDRLQVIAPQIAMRLAGFSDADLINILPPASADTSPPEDRRTALWEAVWEPLCSSASNCGQVHLQAFLAYAIHAQELAVYEAHAATDGPDQRRAAADFIYWQHVGQLIADGLDA
ncbi:hypothetical protein M2272_002357 [Mycobacterium frederiksbergense]|uniref:Secretion protein EspK n=1 Tax=Mycolicibacterium frederiksbergense TaxID=117567 RepID=A0ABT6KYD9_9MYCO|nr:hypothetical protein [Mycolicibacterium frederiksbergense]MDH6195717.1 hypothetical protein [Mycolicibacterium frederiksbergense]